MNPLELKFPGNFLFFPEEFKTPNIAEINLPRKLRFFHICRESRKRLLPFPVDLITKNLLDPELLDSKIKLRNNYEIYQTAKKKVPEKTQIFEMTRRVMSTNL